MREQDYFNFNILWSKELMYSKIIVVWKDVHGSTTQLTLFDKTEAEALDCAVSFGYKQPVWYKPWTYSCKCEITLYK